MKSTVVSDVSCTGEFSSGREWRPIQFGGPRSDMNENNNKINLVYSHGVVNSLSGGQAAHSISIE